MSDVLTRFKDAGFEIAEDSLLLNDIEEGNIFVVAQALLKRSRKICSRLWSQKLDDTKTRGGLSVEEVALLLKGIHEYGEDYSAIARHLLPNRTIKDIYSRWINMKSKFENMFLDKEGLTKEEMRKRDSSYNFGK
jgi:hypothetical protein